MTQSAVMKLVISSQEGSASFRDRVLVLDARGGQVPVGRSSPQNKPSEDNAVFDCKVWRLLLNIFVVSGELFLSHYNVLFPHVGCSAC